MVEQPGQADRGSSLSAPPEKLSAFIAKILEQLALSAWLPAALLAASLAVLYQLRKQADLDVPSAVTELVKDPVVVLIVTIPVVVLTTLVTQSFSFEAIRALEGYWQRRWLLGPLHHLLLFFRLRRKKSLEARIPSALDHGFMPARGSMLRAGLPDAVIKAIEDDLYERPRPDLEAREERLRAALNWRDYGDPTQVAKYDRLLVMLREYPSDGLLMPTQLGNVLRSTEAKLKNTGGDLEFRHSKASAGEPADTAAARPIPHKARYVLHAGIRCDISDLEFTADSTDTSPRQLHRYRYLAIAFGVFSSSGLHQLSSGRRQRSWLLFDTAYHG